MVLCMLRWARCVQHKSYLQSSWSEHPYSIYWCDNTDASVHLFWETRLQRDITNTNFMLLNMSLILGTSSGLNKLSSGRQHQHSAHRARNCPMPIHSPSNCQTQHVQDSCANVRATYSANSGELLCKQSLSRSCWACSVHIFECVQGSARSLLVTKCLRESLGPQQRSFLICCLSNYCLLSKSTSNSHQHIGPHRYSNCKQSK